MGAKRALKPKQIWEIRFYLNQHRRLRDRALFDLAIDSKLRGCDVVRLKIGDLVSGGQVRARAIVMQQKKGRLVQFEPLDVQSRSRWEDYTRAKQEMLERTHIPEAPWWVVEAVDKKKARLNCIAHLLEQIPYDDVPKPEVTLPERVRNEDYIRHAVPAEMHVPDRF